MLKGVSTTSPFDTVTLTLVTSQSASMNECGLTEKTLRSGQSCNMMLLAFSYGIPTVFGQLMFSRIQLLCPGVACVKDTIETSSTRLTVGSEGRMLMIQHKFSFCKSGKN